MPTTAPISIATSNRMTMRASCLASGSPAVSSSRMISILSESLVPPTANVRPGRGGLFDSIKDLRQVHYIVSQPRKMIGQAMIAVPAMFGAITVIHLAPVKRICRALQKLLDQVDGVVQIVIVHVAAVDVYLAFELRAERFPIALENVAEIVIVAPVFGDRTIYLAGHLVPDALRIAVGSHRRVNRLPDVPLIARPALRSQNQLLVIHLFERRGQVSEIVAESGARRALPLALDVIGVIVFVDVYHREGAKIDRIGTCRETSVEHIRVEHLGGQRFPAAGRAAVSEARPALPYAAELLLYVWDQLVIDSVAVWPQVGRIDRVGIVVVRIRMLNFDNDEALEVGADPVLVKLVGVLLLDFVIARDFKALDVIGLQVRVRRRFAESPECVREMAVKHHQRVTGFWMLVEAVWQQHACAEVHRASPELRQLLALNFYVLDVPGVLGRLDRRYRLIERYRNRLRPARIDLDLSRLAVEIAGSQVPMLPFSAIHRQLHRTPVRPFECFVLMQQRLNPVSPGRNLSQAFPRVAEDGAVDKSLLPRLQAVNVNPENLLSLRAVVDLHPRFLRIVGRDHKQHPAIESGWAEFRRE